MNKIIGVLMLVGVSLPSSAQHLLTLDSCRAMALRNNKQLSISRMKQDVAANLRKSARTKYLPHVSALGTYQFTSKEISLLNSDKKAALSGMGTNLATGIQSGMAHLAPQMASVAGMLESAGVSVSALQANLNAGIGNLATDLNGVGQGIVDAFRSDTRNIWAGSIMLTQPIFMGGAIVAMNKMADISEQMAQNSMDGKRQMTYYETDRIYWQVVSLKHKQRLAESYVAWGEEAG
jgi:outer membrane protein TolC